MARPRRLPDLPELFLGLLSIGIAVVLTARIVSGTIHARSHVHDTISVTGSARKPISSDLVRWSLSVSHESPDAATAARRLRNEAAGVRAFLEGEGIPAAAISPTVVRSEKEVTVLPRHVRRVSYRVT